MRLDFMPQDIYVLTSTYQERAFPQQAGFIWDRLVKKHWATKDPEKASKLAQYASPECRNQLEIALKKMQEMVELSSATTANVALPAPAGLDYFGYQKAGILFAWEKKRSYIADEMGLGKTIQAIGLINAEPRIKSALIVTKASLRINWINELKRWLVRKDLTIGLAKGNQWPATDIVVINYEILVRHKGSLDARNWGLIVMDEAQLIKNPKAQRSQMIYGWTPKEQNKKRILPVQAEFATALSGTPIENKPIELFPMLKYLDPVNWGNWFKYVTTFCDGKQEGFGWNTEGSSNKELLQNELRKTVMVRRLKADVMKDLPPKIYQVIEIPVEDSKMKKAISQEVDDWDRSMARASQIKYAMDNAKKAGDKEGFRALMKDLKSELQVKFQDFSKQRRKTGIQKLPYIKQYLKELLEDDPHKILVFAHHQEVIDNLEREFPYSAKVYGPTPADKRQGIVDKYNNDPNMLPFFGSLGAAGAGLNITSAAHVIHVEEDIVPERMNQADDRAHRIGQTKSVLITHLVLEGSLDARLAHIAASKGSVIDVILGSENSRIEMTTEGWGSEFVEPVTETNNANAPCPF